MWRRPWVLALLNGDQTFCRPIRSTASKTFTLRHSIITTFLGSNSCQKTMEIGICVIQLRKYFLKIFKCSVPVSDRQNVWSDRTTRSTVPLRLRRNRKGLQTRRTDSLPTFDALFGQIQESSSKGIFRRHGRRRRRVSQPGSS